MRSPNAQSFPLRELTTFAGSACMCVGETEGENEPQMHRRRLAGRPMILLTPRSNFGMKSASKL